MTQELAIVVQHLCKTVSDGANHLTILDDISFQIGKGESVAIIGASGSGKSTLLGLMAGLDVPSAGEVILAGQSLFALDEEGRSRFRASHVGFVFQSFQLLPHLTALENVLMPLELARADDIHGRASRMLERVELGHRLNHTPKTLSGGEQQRVALARAFVGHPPIIFADEPTGSLDAATGARVIDLMFDLQRQTGATLVLVTHDQSLAARCDRQLQMQSGRLLV